MAETKQLVALDPDVVKRWAIDHGYKVGNPVDLVAEGRYVIPLLKVAPAVGIDDLPALKTALEGINGIQEASLLAFGVAPAAADKPAADTLKAFIEVNFKSIKPIETE